MSVCFRIRSTVVIIRSPAVKLSPSRYGFLPSDLERAASTTLADLEGGGDSQISFSVTHGWSAFGGADHGWQDAELGRGAWTLSDAVSGSVGPQGAATNVSSLRVGADRSWRSQEHSADGGPACGW